VRWERQLFRHGSTCEIPVERIDDRLLENTRLGADPV
jgi:hypothetical protein